MFDAEVQTELCTNGQVFFGQRMELRKGLRPTGHAAKITALFFLHDHLYTGDHDGMIIVWHISDGRYGLSNKRKKPSKKDAAKAKRMERMGQVLKLGPIVPSRHLPKRYTHAGGWRAG